MELNLLELKILLDDKAKQYNTVAFIELDPISVPHRYSLKEDIEIVGLLSATIAWGNRKMIVRNGHRMMDLMGKSPFDFIMSHNNRQLDRFDGFVHRTLNDVDLKYFMIALKHIYLNHGGLETVFGTIAEQETIQDAIHRFKQIFFEIPHPERTTKHISDPYKGSAAKKINMYLRWMVRNDKQGVDFGIWKTIKPSQLHIPLDVHVGNIARKLHLLERKQNDWLAVVELTEKLKEFDSSDPVKYDFALFGLGVFDKL